MSFLTVALSHTSGDVRERAEKVIVSLYNNCGTVIKNYLPSDDDKTRKNLLYKQLFKEFDKIDASLTPEDLRVGRSLNHCRRNYTRTIIVNVYDDLDTWQC